MNALLHQLVAIQAARTPNATAVVHGAAELSYRELDNRANRLANHLRELGVGAESFVGVCLERGFDLVVALLGVWRAGGAYVPISPGLPAVRRRWLVEDTGLRILLTRSSLPEMSAVRDVRVVNLGTDRSIIDACGVAAPEIVVEPDSAAYVLYTSGSTGQPKGVVITHEGIGNRVDWQVRRHDMSVGDRVIQKTSIGFDAACWEFFAPLISGGAVVLAPIGAERDPSALVAAIAEQEVTILQGVPSVLRLLADEPGWAECVTLRLVFSAGEPLEAELCRRLRADVPVEIWNTYGPTECSIDVTAQAVEPWKEAGRVPIGRPLDRLRVLVLDPDGQLAPAGAVGELYVGGIGLGRCYLGRPDLTADRFVPDGFGPPGARLYRTGDRVRWRTDGCLEYIGRVDGQLKVDGVRIEPGEVESALVSHPGVVAAAVAGFRDGEGRTRMAAHVVSNGELRISELRANLAEWLPEVMVPAVFLEADALPLTENGKVDRAALPVPAASSSGRYAEPRTSAEHMVARAWEEVLGTERVGVYDDFFRLGGSSLKLAKLANLLRARTDVDIATRDLFLAATVEDQAKLLDESGERPASLTPVSRQGALPLSFGQHRLWFLDKMNPGGREWVAPLFLRLPAALAPADVQRALDTVEARHEALRTRYVTQGDEPRQFIDRPGEVELRVVDFCGSEPSALFGEQFERGFDLRHGPLWRAMLIRIPGEEHLLLVTVHHIASDGRTTVVLTQELRELCSARLEGREPELPELSVQYADFAAWQRARLTDEVVSRELAYWRGNLEGLPRLELPLDRGRPVERDPHGSGARIEIPDGTAEAVIELGRRHGATPFMTLLTAFAALLARYAGQWDVPIGTPVAGRNRPGLENVAGFFLNSLVLRCELTPDLSFVDAVRKVRKVVTSAFAHQELPFERIVDLLEPTRDLSRTPLYQVAFDLQEEGDTSAVLADTTSLDAFQKAWQVAKTDLTLFVWQGEEGLTAAFEYATSIFDESTVLRLAEHFSRLLAAIAADPDARLGRLDFLTSAETEQLVSGWNATTTPLPQVSVLDLFESRVAADGAAVAVTTDEATVSYAELNMRADRVAGCLRRRGVGAGAVVGVVVERGVDLVASLLGVWKAGAAYVPVEPSFPTERIRLMLASAGVKAVVGSANAVDRSDATEFLVVSEMGNVDEPVSRNSELDDLAYVIFTSGSTGTPKGVQVTHRGLADHVLWAAAELAARGTSGAPLFSSVAFDLVVPNLWAPLVTGQRVHLVDPESESAGLGAALEAAGPFSFVKLTPGHLEILLHQLTAEQAASLASVIVVAGEALPGALATKWLSLLGPGRLINEYGPTEASVGTSVFPVNAPQDVDVVPIGRPLPNATMYVLDAGLGVAPVGAPGELYVGGIGVARGYAGRPDLTAGRFVPDPFGEPGDRLYRTGDRVRRLPSGDIAFLGRVDDQVKIRGYRIEPGEVKAVIDACPGVRASAVVARRERLVAYYVGDAPGLAEHCAAFLPGYLMPSLFVPLDELPLNANGKVDREALPDTDKTEAEPPFAVPRNVIEERISEIFTELLGTDIGVLRSFFRSGGHSILAVRLVSRLQECFEVDLPIRLVFEQPTVAGIAEAVEERIKAEVAALSDTELARMGEEAET
ncbi:non-ribosomal peptide synthetase [Amycolatopsis sp. WAC 04169]|uniref:non-ribosomal peptide synthetase n=1 Tax=Amycolatopsis sp. WAC 04169 TaxID=2203197 RepID=UPI0018F61537|nr:non-ribosomal peptide synthetase [Amycolatopsis sp. WAC 04169]